MAGLVYAGILSDIFNEIGKTIFTQKKYFLKSLALFPDIYLLCNSKYF